MKKAEKNEFEVFAGFGQACIVNVVNPAVNSK